MAQGSETAAKRPLVAVVDDDSAVCGSLKFSLELEGFVVRTYCSGAELLQADDLNLCSCFVIDQIMPGMTGMELLDELRNRQVLTPVILIVSDPKAALKSRAREAAIVIVEKPLLGNTLMERIREACEQG